MPQSLNWAYLVEESAGVCEFSPRSPESGNSDRTRYGLPRPAGASPALIALNDISTLDWIGFLLLELGRFLRALRGAYLKVCATKAKRYMAVLTTLLGEGWLGLSTDCWLAEACLEFR